MEKSHNTVTVWLLLFCPLFLFAIEVIAQVVHPVQIGYYGKLVDQNSQPVAEATVHGLVYDSLDYKAGAVEKIIVQTGSDGSFQISATGMRFDILTVKKQGYEFSSDRRQDLTFVFAGLPAEELFVPDPAKPVVFRIRKKNPPAFLIRSKGLLRFKPGQDKPYVLTAPMGRFRDFNESVRAGRQLPAGLKVTASLSNDGLQYNLTFDSPDDGSGVITSDEILHECPAHSYANQTVMNVKIPDKAEETEKYAYVRAKGSDGIEWIYSRIDLHIIVGKAELIINTASWTNPDGSRNLEYDKKFQQRESARRIEEYENNPAPDKGPMPYYLRRPQLRGRDWNFAAQRRRANKLRREHLRAADGKTREKKRTVNRPKEDK